MKLIETECILHTGFVNKTGYGMKWCNTLKRMTTAHKAVWINAGRAVPKGQDVMHLCHNRICINLDHLMLGTRSENLLMRTAEMAGRGGAAGRGTHKTEKKDISCPNACGIESTVSGIVKHLKAGTCATN